MRTSIQNNKYIYFSYYASKYHISIIHEHWPIHFFVVLWNEIYHILILPLVIVFCFYKNLKKRIQQILENSEKRMLTSLTIQNKIRNEFNFIFQRRNTNNISIFIRSTFILLKLIPLFVPCYTLPFSIWIFLYDCQFIIICIIVFFFSCIHIRSIFGFVPCLFRVVSFLFILVVSFTFSFSYDRETLSLFFTSSSYSTILLKTTWWNDQFVLMYGLCRIPLWQ